MRTYPEIAVTGFARRAVFARYPDPEIHAGATDEEYKRYRQQQDAITAAVFADPEVAAGRAIEDALNAALERAFEDGVCDADVMAQAAVDDHDLCEALDRPGAARRERWRRSRVHLTPTEERALRGGALLAGQLTKIHWIIVGSRDALTQGLQGR